MVAGGRAFPAASFGICCAMPVEVALARSVSLTQRQQRCRDLICKLQHPGRVGKRGWTFLLKSFSLLFFLRGQMQSG